MLEQKTKVIGGRTWMVTQFTGTKTLRVMYALTKSLGPAVAALSGALGGKKPTSVLDMNVDLSEVVKQFLAGNASEAEVEKLIFTLLQNAVVDNRAVTKDMFDEVFAGPRFFDLPTVLAFVIEANYGDFFSALMSSTDQASSAPQANLDGLPVA